MNTKIPDELIIEACKALEIKRENCGSWVDGVPDIFNRLLKYRPDLKSQHDWVLAIQDMVKIQSIRILSEQKSFEPKGISDLDNLIKMLQKSEMPYKIVEDSDNTQFDIDYAIMLELDNKGSRSSIFDPKVNYRLTPPPATGTSIDGIGYMDHCSVWLFDKYGSLIIVGHYE